MRKNVIVLLLMASLLAISAPLAQGALVPPAVVLNGERLSFTTEPVLVASRWLVPLRGIFSPLGATLDYDPDTKMIYADRGTTHIEMQIDNPVAYINGQENTLDVPPQAVNGSTMVPLRFVAESLKAKVEYRKENNTVTIALKENQDLSTGIYDAYMCEGWDEGTSSPINPTTVINSKSEKAYAYVVLNEVLSGEISANWYFLGNGKRELITSYTLDNPGYYSYYFWIANSIFKNGDWECELVLNGQPAKSLFFEIVEDTGEYGTIDFMGGVYTGYLKNGVPSGNGEWVSSSGYQYVGYFSYSASNLKIDQAEVNYGDDNYAYCDLTIYSDNTSYYNGYYYYPDGTVFVGEWLFGLDGTMFERGTYYNTDGTQEDVDTIS